MLVIVSAVEDVRARVATGLWDSWFGLLASGLAPKPSTLQTLSPKPKF